MTENEKEMMNSIFAKIAELDYIKPEDIPNIDSLHGSGHNLYGRYISRPPSVMMMTRS